MLVAILPAPVFVTDVVEICNAELVLAPSFTNCNVPDKGLSTFNNPTGGVYVLEIVRRSFRSSYTIAIPVPATKNAATVSIIISGLILDPITYAKFSTVILRVTPKEPLGAISPTETIGITSYCPSTPAGSNAFNWVIELLISKFYYHPLVRGSCPG